MLYYSANMQILSRSQAIIIGWTSSDKPRLLLARVEEFVFLMQVAGKKATIPDRGSNQANAWICCHNTALSPHVANTTGPSTKKFVTITITVLEIAELDFVFLSKFRITSKSHLLLYTHDQQP
eukprot:g18725.t1